jgi:cysteine desulfurase NifS
VTSVLEGDPYRIRSLIVHGASLLTSWPQTPLWRETLSKLDFLVCIDRQLTADAAYADIVLPATTMFEIDSYMVYGPIFRLREKVIEPVGEARNDYLIMAELAQRLGYGERYPQTEEALIRHALEGSGYSLEEVRDAGGWVKLATPLMECYEPLPKYTEPVEGPLARPDLAATFPLVFNSGARPHTDFRSQHHGIDGLVRDNPEPTVEINEIDPRGAVPFRAVVTDAIVAGAIECNMGGGTPVGPAAWQEWNVNELTDLANADDISGFPVYKALLCDVVKVEAGAGNVRKTTQPAEQCGPVTLSAPAQRPRPSRRIYLDNNATTRVAHVVREAMLPSLDASLGNPSSIHGAGRDAREAVENARRQVARLVNARPRRIVFTGGGSESDNLALKGVAFAHRDRGTHIITSAIEHPAVLETCRFLETMGFRITYLGVDECGAVSPDALARALTDDTILVSVMMANNEVGTIQPIAELCRLTHERGALFHTDAVQAAGKIPIDVRELDVDLLSLSGHKFHGPKGIGMLFVKRGVTLAPLVHGGKQEAGLRAGTENVPAIVGMGRAAELAVTTIEHGDAIRRRRDDLHRRVRSLIPEATLNGHPDHRLPNTLNLTVPGLRGESLVVALDQHGVSLSSGSACKSGSPEPTHVLLAMGKAPEHVHCSIRLSLSHETSDDDVDAVGTALARVLEEMETTVRFLPCK